MATKKTGEENVRKLVKIGGKSIGVTLPIELVRSLGWREKQKVTVTKKNGALVVRDAKSKK
jgi:antitoxin component of MazEF toxin-antitoxin module